ncbi:hypothetical protein N7520_003552 [Penicillium odoratum]|uniref:uncharacterized protein n=1 Tax=Penicillium odoratum TaxID=1167516 RepID=UPI0025484565|nr:uncharacterized protein N7520_003552 [Penicillium odoratum]KAJ5768993.1 hypothetical protein N7520_003552 [Penicillium odoratum]
MQGKADGINYGVGHRGGATRLAVVTSLLNGQNVILLLKSIFYSTYGMDNLRYGRLHAILKL